MALNVSSEISHLSGVIVHTPGPELSWVHPGMKHELLFDDIIFEEHAREEHLDMLAVFKTIMKDPTQVYEIRTLFSQCFEQKEAREYFIDELIKAFKGYLEYQGDIQVDKLYNFLDSEEVISFQAVITSSKTGQWAVSDTWLMKNEMIFRHFGTAHKPDRVLVKNVASQIIDGSCCSTFT